MTRHGIFLKVLLNFFQKIKTELKIPVRYIGVGEGIDDLQKFDAKSFAEALFDNEG